MSESREERRERLVEVYREASVCTKCPLAETRTNVVFGSGNANADLMFVGEAPGAEEDRQGLPFVGRAGALLTELLGGIGMTREQVWITNVLRCRPPGNRDPQPIEIESCQPYTYGQVELIQPRVIATLGNFATKLLTGSRAGISQGAWHPAGPRDRRADGVPDAAVPSGRGAADALRWSTPCARTSPSCPSCSSGPSPRPAAFLAGRRSSPVQRRGSAPTSSTCSVDDASAAPVRAETEAIGARLAAGLGRATWCWSAASSARARRP